MTTAALNHPGGCLGYRIEHEGRCVVYATDSESVIELDPALVALRPLTCAGASFSIDPIVDRSILFIVVGVFIGCSSSEDKSAEPTSRKCWSVANTCVCGTTEPAAMGTYDIPYEVDDCTMTSMSSNGPVRCCDGPDECECIEYTCAALGSACGCEFNGTRTGYDRCVPEGAPTDTGVLSGDPPCCAETDAGRGGCACQGRPCMPDEVQVDECSAAIAVLHCSSSRQLVETCHP